MVLPRDNTYWKITERLKVKRCKKIYIENTIQKKSSIAMLIQTKELIRENTLVEIEIPYNTKNPS